MAFDRAELEKKTKAELLDLLQAEMVDPLPPFNQDALSRRTKAEILAELDVRLRDNNRQHARRLRAQARSAMRLMGGRTYEAEMEGLHQQVADLERRLEMAQSELRRLRGETVAAYGPVTAEDRS